MDSSKTVLTDVDRAVYFDGLLGDASDGATDVVRIARMHRSEAELLEMVNAGQPLSAVLRVVIDRIERLISGSVGSVHLISDDGRLTCTAGVRQAVAVRAAIDGETFGADEGPCAPVAATGQAVWITDISSDAGWAPWADRAEEQGLGACWCVPAIDPATGKALARLAVHSTGPRSPDLIDTHLLEDMARIVRLAILTDRAERQRVALTEENERTLDRLSRLLEATTEGIYGLDANRRCTFINRAALQMLGIDSEGDVLGGDMHDLIHHSFPDGTEYPLAECPIVKTISMGEPLAADDELMFRSDGSTFPVSISAAPKLDPATGKVTGAVVVFTDVSERFSYQRQLEGALKSKDEFIASIAHELRTPLTAVVGFADLLSSSWEQLEGEEVTDLLGHVSSGADDVAHLVEDLLVAARVDMGEVKLRLEPVDLGAQARTVLTRWRRGELHQVEVTSEADGLVQADPARVRQILRNLLTNALKYGGEAIEVEVGRSGDVRYVDVIDNGHGVPLEQVESIFEPYARAHDVPGVTASLGLGLSISRRLTEAMGGHLTYRRINDRTHFHLAFPVS